MKREMKMTWKREIKLMRAQKILRGWRAERWVWIHGVEGSMKRREEDDRMKEGRSQGRGAGAQRIGAKESLAQEKTGNYWCSCRTL